MSDDCCGGMGEDAFIKGIYAQCGDAIVMLHNESLRRCKVQIIIHMQKVEMNKNTKDITCAGLASQCKP